MIHTESNNLTSLVARARGGDRAAMDSLIHRIQPLIYKLAQRFLVTPADAEDATQDVLLKIITRLNQFDGNSKFMTWVYRVASNHLLDIKRRPTRPTMNFDEFATDLAEGLSKRPYDGPEAAVLLEEIRIGCTLAMLQCLEQDARMAYILGEILELDHREAAEILEISTAAYRKRLSRARGTIADFMLSHCGLVAPSNACRCSRRVARAKDLGRVNPDNPVFSHSAGIARQFPAALKEIRRLEKHQRTAALYRAQLQPEARQDFVRWLRNTLELHENTRSGGGDIN